MSTITTSDEYVVSERVTLRAGDTFRAKGGPYYVKRDSRGNRVCMSMAARGPFRFMRFCEQGKRQWIEAVARDGTAAVLSLTRRRSILPGALIPRPYTVIGRTGSQKRRRRASAPTRPAKARRGEAGVTGPAEMAAPPAAHRGAFSPAKNPPDSLLTERGN